jgi:(p)ppGpp synthase/HD superfamily hydrolase
MDKAYKLAYKWHTGHVRKKTTIPYISHLMAVSALVLEHGGTEKQAEAALLHDILEDTPCTYEMVRQKVGRKVADMVQACTHVENEGEKSLENWKARKQIYLDHLVAGDHNQDSLLVALADKTHNAEATLRDWVEHSNISNGGTTGCWLPSEICQYLKACWRGLSMQLYKCLVKPHDTTRRSSRINC